MGWGGEGPRSIRGLAVSGCLHSTVVFARLDRHDLNSEQKIDSAVGAIDFSLPPPPPLIDPCLIGKLCAQ
jgi:hypothetical protein